MKPHGNQNTINNPISAHVIHLYDFARDQVLNPKQAMPEHQFHRSFAMQSTYVLSQAARIFQQQVRESSQTNPLKQLERTLRDIEFADKRQIAHYAPKVRIICDWLTKNYN